MGELSLNGTTFNLILSSSAANSPSISTKFIQHDDKEPDAIVELDGFTGTLHICHPNVEAQDPDTDITRKKKSNNNNHKFKHTTEECMEKQKVSDEVMLDDVDHEINGAVKMANPKEKEIKNEITETG